MNSNAILNALQFALPWEFLASSEILRTQKSFFWSTSNGWRWQGRAHICFSVSCFCKNDLSTTGIDLLKREAAIRPSWSCPANAEISELIEFWTNAKQLSWWTGSWYIDWERQSRSGWIFRVHTSDRQTCINKNCCRTIATCKISKWSAPNSKEIELFAIKIINVSAIIEILILVRTTWVNGNLKVPYIRAFSDFSVYNHVDAHAKIVKI